jgi:hypothetical protein
MGLGIGGSQLWISGARREEKRAVQAVAWPRRVTGLQGEEGCGGKNLGKLVLCGF